MEEGVSVAAPRGDMDGSLSRVTDISESCGGETALQGRPQGPLRVGTSLPRHLCLHFTLCLGQPHSSCGLGSPPSLPTLSQPPPSPGPPRPGLQPLPFAEGGPQGCGAPKTERGPLGGGRGRSSL